MELRDATSYMNKPLSPASVDTVDVDDDELESSAFQTVQLMQLQRTHDEYVKSSCEYERELELEVERHEKKAQQLEAMALVLEREKCNLQTTLIEAKDELQTAHRRDHLLQTQLQEMKWKIQRLEQDNDELETSGRIALATIQDLQHQAETLLEQNVFLQHEKEELIKQLSPVVIAESHTTTRLSSSYVSNAASSTELNPTKRRRQKGRRPEVLETCLHLTCRNCRKKKPHTQHSEKRSIAAFFERVRNFLSGRER